MRIWIFIILACFTAPVFAAQDVQLGCKSLRIVLDARLTPAIVEQEWGRGKPLAEVPAMLDLIGCKGELLDRLTLESPLAQIDPAPLKGAPHPTYLVSADLTAEAGSYGGPLTIPVQIVNNRLIPATAQAPDKRLEPINLSMTGKSVWKKIIEHETDNLLLVESRHQCRGFVTFYKRYVPSRYGWMVKVRTRDGLWESKGAFPHQKLFP